MPIDAAGNRADIVMDAASIISRMNIGRFYEHYFSAAARDVTVNLRKILGIVTQKTTPNKVGNLPKEVIDNGYNYLLNFYNIVSEKQYTFFKNRVSEDEKIEHLATVCSDIVRIFYPIENQKDIIETIKTLESSGIYKPTYGPISYTGNSGERITSINNIRIAPLYVMLLEKIADDWSSVSSGKLQHFGVLSPIIKSEKFSNPYRNSPVRTIGETEARIFSGYCGREAIAEMMDRSNNPTTQRNIVYNILSAPQPTNIDSVVDRNFIQLGGAKPIQLVKHIFGVSGFLPVYETEDK